MTAIPLGQARRDAGRKPPRDSADAPVCPVIALGRDESSYYFLDTFGAIRRMSAAQLGQRPQLSSLFGGDTAWMKQSYPQSRVVDGIEVESGFSNNAICDHLMRACADAGFYGPHIVVRDVGLWRDEVGAPAVHCGDAVYIAGAWHASGARIADTVYPVAPRQRRPSFPAAAEVGRDIEARIARLWNFRDPGASMVVVGQLATAILGTAALWRPSLFLCAAVGWGKSSLMDVMRACSPIHHYTDDTSAAGVQGAVNGRAMPVFIDEASDRDNTHGKQAILDIVLSSTRGDGTHGHRGTVDGKSREIRIAASFVYGSVAPPEMQPQHESRITIVHMTAPAEGADHAEAMAALCASAAGAAPGLWARMIAGFDRWKAALALFRETLRRAGCDPRERDQHGAILAGWWTLTRDGLPTEAQARAAVAGIGAFIRLSEDVADESSARRVIGHLMAKAIKYDSTTREASIGMLVQSVLDQHAGIEHAVPHYTSRDALARHGIRVILASETHDRGRAVPRMGAGDGLWLYPALIARLYDNTAWQANRWYVEILRLPTGRKATPGWKIRFSPHIVGAAIWVGADDFSPSEAVSFNEMVAKLALPVPTMLGLVERSGFPVAHKPDPQPNPLDYPDGTLLPGWLFDVDRVKRFITRAEQDMGV